MSAYRVVSDFSLLVAAVVYGVFFTLLSIAPIVGSVLRLFLVLSLVHYAYSVLQCCAQGHKDVPPPDFDTISPMNQPSMLVHFVAFPALIIFCWLYLAVWALFITGVIAAFPASAALMAVTRRLESAFSPVAIFTCMRLLGRDYAYLLGATFVLVMAAAFFPGLVAGETGLLHDLLSAIVTAWALLALFAMTGAAVHRHHLDFDIPGENADKEERARQDVLQTWQRVLDQAYASLRSGNPEAGYRELRNFLAQNDSDPQAYYWLIENLFEWEDKRHALGVSSRLIEQELGQGRHANALDLYRRCRRVDPEFLPPAAAAGALSAYAQTVGQLGAASELAGGAVGGNTDA